MIRTCLNVVKTTFVRILSVVFLGLAMSACFFKEEHADGDISFCIEDALADKLGFADLEMAQVTERLLLNARVSFNKDKVVPYYSLLDGQVTSVHFSLGDYVKEGSVLATVRSEQTASLSNDLTEAKDLLALAEREKTLTKRLHESGVASGRELMEAESQLRAAQSRLNSIKEQMRIMGSAEGDMLQHIRAPHSGYIVQRAINPGMNIGGGGEPLFTISSLDDVWVIASVFESDIRKMQEGQPVRIKTVAHPDTLFEGKIDYISNVLDPEQKVLQVRINIDNTGKLLKPEMFASVEVDYSLGLEMLSVPTDALIFDRNSYFVVVSDDWCELQVTEVEIFSHNASKTFIKADLSPGQQVIAKNQLLVYHHLQY